MQKPVASTSSVGDNFEESTTYQYIRTKLSVRSYSKPADAVNYFQSLVNHNQGTNNIAILKYGLALAYLEAKDYDSARFITR